MLFLMLLLYSSVAVLLAAAVELEAIVAAAVVAVNANIVAATFEVVDIKLSASSSALLQFSHSLACGAVASLAPSVQLLLLLLLLLLFFLLLILLLLLLY